MGDASSRKVIYEAMRQARGVEPEAARSGWRRKAMVGGGSALTLVGGLGALFIWQAFTHVTTTRASVCAAVVMLSSDADARAKRLLVEPGQTVAAGDVLVQLDDSDARAALASAEAAQAVAQARVETAQADLELRATRLPEEIRRAEAERAEAAARLAQLKAGARPEEIESARVRLSSARTMAELYTGDVAQSELLLKHGYISRHDVDVERARMTTQRNTAREAELTLVRLEAGPRETEVQAVEQTLAAREAALALARSGEKQIESMKADLAARKAELARAEADVNRGRSALERMAIVSPVAGTVIRTFIHEGELCRRGVTAVLVADDSAGRWVEGFVREKDARLLKVGQPANVEMVIGSGEYVEATVEAVALATSSLGESETGAARPAPIPETVWVRLRPKSVQGTPLPGMSASAVIRVR